MSLKDHLIARLPSSRKPEPSRSPGEPQPMRPRVSMIAYNPILYSEGGQTLYEFLGWSEPYEAARQFISDIQECSNGLVEFQIAEWAELDAWPVKEDGFRYDDVTYLQCWRSRTGWHTPDMANYEAVLAEFELLDKVESGQIDEVWLFAFPYAGFYQSRVVGPGAFWCNSPGMDRTDVSRRFLIMGFNYERGMLTEVEGFGHRVESMLKRVWRKQREKDNLWTHFTRYDKIAPGQANCGNVHFAPNSLQDYDWGNPNPVPSNCDDWLNFPDFQGLVREVDCSEWGDGDLRAHHMWWLKHLPRAAGQTRGISNNWWWYVADPNAVP